MRIVEITVENHSRLADAKFSVGPHLVLIGPNNSGKSALIRLLVLTLSPSMSTLYQQLSHKDVRDHREPMRVSVVLGDLSQDELAAFPDQTIATEGESGYRIGIVLTVEVEDADTSSISIERRFLEKPNSRPSRQQLEAIGFRNVSATRSVAGDNVTGKGSAFRALLSDIELGDDENKLRAILNSFDTELAASGTLTDLRKSLAKHLSVALPRELDSSDLHLHSAGVEDDDVLSNVGISIADEDGDGRELSSQSDGTRSLISMTFYDYSASKANIVSIDEPENHLHPSAQRALAQMLKNGQNQKILATHSSAIVQGFDPECVVAFDSQSNLRCVPHGTLSAQDKLMAQWWTSSRLEPLTSRFILMVEGESDRIFVEVAARSFRINLDRLGISVFDLGGAGEFSNAYRIFGESGYNLSLRGLVDKDAADKWAKAMGVEVTDLGSKGIVVCDLDLEDEYLTALSAARCRDIFDRSSLFTENELKAFPTSNEYAQLKPWFKGSGKKTRSAIALGQHLTRCDLYRIPAVKALLLMLKTN